LDAIDWCPIDQVEARLTAGVFQPVLEYLRAELPGNVQAASGTRRA
jgi:hypothetical protein